MGPSAQETVKTVLREPESAVCDMLKFEIDCVPLTVNVWLPEKPESVAPVKSPVADAFCVLLSAFLIIPVEQLQLIVVLMLVPITMKSF